MARISRVLLAFRSAHYAGLPKPIRNIGPVTHQSSDLGKLTIGIERGNHMAHRERRKLHAPGAKELVGADVECVGQFAHEGGEGRFDLAAGTGIEDLSLQSDSACSF